MNPQREWFEKDYYDVLGVSEKASAKEINTSYRKLARELHPDANPGDDSAEERFKAVSAAYEVLGDESKRAEYDEVRTMARSGGGFGRAGGASSYDLGDLGGIFDLFGRGSGPRNSRPQPARGANVEADLHLSFEDAARGVTTTVHLTTDAACDSCGGSGAKSGTQPVPCGECGGAGVVSDDQGLFSFSRPCGRCGGIGSLIKDPCAQCHGSGVMRKQRRVKVRIPAGIDPGKKIRVKGHGGPGAAGGPTGDLLVKVTVGEHPFFTRRGKNLRLTLPVSMTEAALGADLTVPTLDDETVTLRLPSGTPSGRILRVAGSGVKGGEGPGDLLVTIHVVVPDVLTDPQREAMAELDDVLDPPDRAYLGT